MIAAIDLTARLLAIFTPPERCTVSECATKYRYMSSESSSQKGGKFTFDLAPWQREVCDSVAERGVRRVVCMWASQLTGKTEVANNIVAYRVIIDPGPMLLVQPTLEMGETWSKDRLMPSVRDSARLRDLIDTSKSRDSGNTILHKRFPGGHLTIAGANSPASLASRPISLLIFDEVDRYGASAGTEGDPIALAEKRTESFPDARVIMFSTPGTKGLSRIEAAFNESDKRYWFCSCVQCGHWQTLKWLQVRWDGKDPLSARYHCEKCDHGHTDGERRAIVKAGEWRPTAKGEPGVRGYHMNGLYCLFPPHEAFPNRLAQAIAKAEEEKVTRERYKVWVNTFLAETYEDETEYVPPAEKLMERCEDYPEDHLPDGVLIIVGQVDVQKDRLEAELDGWGAGEERWKLLRRSIPGDPEQIYVWEQLDEFLSQPFKTHDGQTLNICTAFIDRRHKGKAVDSFTRRNVARRWYSCQGGKDSMLPLASTPKQRGASKAYVYTIGTHDAKRTIFARLANGKPGPNYIHFPNGRGFDYDYFKSVCSEKLVTEMTRFGPKQSWVKTANRNEGLDLMVYGFAAMFALQPNWGLIAKNLAKLSKSVQVESHTGEDRKPDEAKSQADEAPGGQSNVAPVVPKSPRRSPYRPGGWMRKGRF